MIEILTLYITDIVKYVMSNFQTGGLIVLLGILLFDRKHLSIDLGGVAKFVGFMAIVVLMKLALLPPGFYKSPPYYQHLSLEKFLFVGLEDAFFVMIPYYLTKITKSNIVSVLIWIVFSLIFAGGHMYQGLTSAAITAIYPYFISYRYIKKTTLSTVMVCHFMYDCLIYLVPKIHNLLQLV